jgi:IcmF-related N-terminal domain
MFGFLTAIWDLLRRIVGIILPVGKGIRFTGLSSAVRWTLHILLLVTVLIVLYLLNRPLGLPGLIPTTPRFIAELWLPILFLLIYVLAWAAWWLYKLLSADEEQSVFPDIDEAWGEAVEALGKAGVSLTDLPLFFVLGRPEAPEEDLFNAAQLQLVVRQTPSRAAPLHVYASRDAVYVTCAGASLTGKQASILAVEGLPHMDAASGGGDEFDPGKTLTARAPAEQRVIKMVAKTVGRQATGLERRVMRRLGGFKLPELLKNTSEVELQTARLEHLCRLIVRDRRPYCPINGLLLLVPLGSTDTDLDAQQTGELMQRDLAAVQGTLKVDCPLFALVCDLETLPGFREFIVRLPVRDRERRLGQRFPLAPEIDGEQLLDYVDSSVQWVCGSLLRDWVFKLFRVETPGRDAPADVTAANANLYLLLDELRERQKRLGRVLRVAFARHANGPLRFGGCYLAGTGHDPDREQALVAGLFRRLIDHQNDVSWTDQAMKENESAERVAKMGYGVLAGAGLAVVVLLALVFLGGRSHHS